jgi:hypothetical protein
MEGGMWLPLLNPDVPVGRCSTDERVIGAFDQDLE